MWCPQSVPIHYTSRVPGEEMQVVKKLKYKNVHLNAGVKINSYFNWCDTLFSNYPLSKHMYVYKYREQLINYFIKRNRNVFMVSITIFDF